MIKPYCIGYAELKVRAIDYVELKVGYAELTQHTSTGLYMTRIVAVLFGTACSCKKTFTLLYREFVSIEKGTFTRHKRDNVSNESGCCLRARGGVTKGKWSCA